MTRMHNSIRNTKYAIIGQTIGIAINFLSRIVFIKTLGAEYLGINGLFSNILSMLSLAELGVGPAIVYSLYKPLAEDDIPKVKALMVVFKKSYITIGIIIGMLGLLITPFLTSLIRDMPNIPNIRLIFLLFVMNSAISYFFSYKRSLIIADQKRYIATLYRYGFYSVLNILQMVILLWTHNFILFLIVQICSTFLENIWISKKADKLYPYLKERDIEKLDIKTKGTIVRNVKAMILHKVGGIVVNGTDNLLLSKFIGIITVGLYSNYLLIINALNTVFGMVFQAVTASIGNLGATESEKNTNFIFDCLNLIGFWIYGFASICLINLFNPFIRLWVGEKYLLPISLVLVIILNFYLKGMRLGVLTFKDALGLYWYDRFKPIFEASINLIISIYLATKIGALGIFIGTAISTITTCFWVEPYILYKYGFKTSVKPYFMKYISYTIIMLITGLLTWFASNYVTGYTIISFGLRLVISIVIPNVIFLILFWRTKEFKYLLMKLRSTIIVKIT